MSEETTFPGEAWAEETSLEIVSSEGKSTIKTKENDTSKITSSDTIAMIPNEKTFNPKPTPTILSSLNSTTTAIIMPKTPCKSKSNPTTSTPTRMASKSDVQKKTLTF